MKKSIYSMCGMCTVRCHIRAEVEDNRVTWMEGNQHILGGALCARGAAGVALRDDTERPQGPLIREGARGEGKWRQVSWEEALDHVAGKLGAIKEKYGPQSIVVSSRGGPWQGLYKTFVHAIGSPNYTNHDNTCGRNTHHASLSVNGVARKGLQYDYKNARHLVLFGRNLFAALLLTETRAVMEMLQKGGRLTYVDVRVTETSSKATRFFHVRPGTDYALALAMVHQVIRENAYDAAFVDKYVKDFSALCTFVEPYTPAWAAKECGVDEDSIINFVREINEDRPKVIFHPGWNLSRYNDSFYASRMLHILNGLMGSVEMEGGLFFPKGPGDCGVKSIRTVDCKKPDIERADGCGTTYPQFEKGPGLAHLLFPAMKTGKPYPVKAWLAMRHDPFTCMPDPEQQKEYFDHCDLLVSIDTHYSEFGWYADVILPESMFLERDNHIIVQKGLKPRLAVRRKIVEPRFDTKAAWDIFRQLAVRMGVEEYFPYETIEEFWSWQLEPTGFTMKDFEEKGFIELADKPVFYNRDELEGKFKTPSGKIEVISGVLEKAGLPSLKPYQSPAAPPAGKFRLVYGRVAVHTHSHTQNNPLLHQMMDENNLWINTRQAEQLGIGDGDMVEVRAANGYGGRLRAFVTDFIHPEAVFTVHGFGRQVPRQTRTHDRGVSDQRLMAGLLDVWDQAGGAISLCESFVTVKPAR
ncbi:MAG TPA: thiosulfate reductase [Desulfobulbus sp.]|nr:thiosulfate reductase [Desulfobulbus sp.]